MSNDLILSIKNQMPAIAGGVDEDTRAVAGGGNGGVKRISIKGGVFRKYAGGKEVGAIEDRHMEVIFVKMAHNPARTFYSQGYQEGVKISPACWSSDSKTPDSEVKNPVASSCNACPNSVKGSGTNGLGSACKLSWRTAVVLPQDPAGDVMQLTLPPTSCFGEEDNGRYPFRAYVQMLAANNISAGRVITRMAFDTKSPVPKLLFSPVAAVPQDQVDMILAQSKSNAAESAVKMTVFQSDEAAAPAAPAEPMVSKAAAAPSEPDASELLKKWGKGKK
jgi:hypothetical protein